MKKLLFILCLSTLIGKEPGLIEVKMGYFFFSDSKMRHLYNQGGLDVQLAGSYTFRENIALYGSVEYAQRSGGITEENLTIQLIPLSLAIKPIFSLSSFTDYYLIVGPRYAFALLEHGQDTSGLGLLAGTGFLFHYGPMVLDLFGEYSYVPLQLNSLGLGSQSIGGLTFGTGLGLAF